MNLAGKVRQLSVNLTAKRNLLTGPRSLIRLCPARYPLAPFKVTPVFNSSRTFCRPFSTTPTDTDYETLSEETLESLGEYFEELLERDERMIKSDVSLASGVLNVTIPGHGTYVINKQTPNRQIWLSSPLSGPYRFDLVLGQGWVYKHTGETLHHLLNQEVGQKILELENPAFEKCYLGSGLIE